MQLIFSVSLNGLKVGRVLGTKREIQKDTFLYLTAQAFCLCLQFAYRKNFKSFFSFYKK